jgi:glycosyltransferase involved in cell wall biosynthesis
MALAIRSLRSNGAVERPDPTAVFKIVERVMREGDVRTGESKNDLGPDDALALLRAWLESMDLSIDERELLRALQEGELSHPDLERRAKRIHEKQLAKTVDSLIAMTDGRKPLDLGGAARELFDACVPAIPYAAAAAFLGCEKRKLTRNDGDRPRVALIGEGLSAMHGVTHTIHQIRERGVPGFEVEVIGTDADVDRRLSAVAEVDVPFYEGMKIGVPSVSALTDALAEGQYDLVHVTAPGPAGIGAWLLARVLELPLLGSYHTELAAYAGVRSGLAQYEMMGNIALGQFYGGCDAVLSPSPASDERLVQLGIAADKVGRWDRGVDLDRFDPALRRAGMFPGELNVMYAGRLTTEKGVDMLAEAFLKAHDRDPRLHLVLAGGGPEEEKLRGMLGEHATFLGWLYGRDLAVAYASADMFMFASRTDTFGQVILEAQASGLPVVAVAEGGPVSLLEGGQTGILVDADVDALADAVADLAAAPLLRTRLRRNALNAVGGRSWEAAMEKLAAGYGAALQAAPASSRQVA